MLAEVGKAAGERMPARIDDPGIWQDQPDEGHEQPVVRQLVDEEWTIGPPLYARALEIFCTKLAPLIRR